MNTDELLLEGFNRVRELVPAVTSGLSPAQLAEQPGGTGNSIGWLIWHLSRVQDDHLSPLAREDQTWTSQGWDHRFGLDLPAEDTGYGHQVSDVAKVRADADLLTAYHDAVARRTEQFLRGLGGTELDRVIDRDWTPPVTMGVRLISVLADCLQHVGQAAYVRGLIIR